MNNSATMLGADLLHVAQIELVTPTTVAGTLYGTAFTLFCLYVHALAPRLQDQDRQRQTRFMLAYSAVIMLCGLYDLVSNAWVAQDAYINHGSYPDGPFAYIESTFRAPWIIAGFTFQLGVDTLTSAIQIWRVWVIWNTTRYGKFIFVLPSLCFLVWISLKFRILILITTLGQSESVPLITKTDTAELVIQGATTIICTMLISAFLIFEQRRQRKLIGEGQGSAGYMKIVAILIESYALESIWVLLVAVSSISTEKFFAEAQTYMEIIAYLLVQYRVADRKARESQRGQSRISSLHWEHSNHAATTQFGQDSEAGGEVHTSAKPETS